MAITEDNRKSLPPTAQFVQELLDQEDVVVPDVLRDVSFVEMGDDDIPIERYISKEFFDREVEGLWPKVWQLACFEQEIPNPGDHIVYDILHWSFIVTRGADGRIRAFYNSCPHRARQLRTDDGCVGEFRCPYHGMAWTLEGDLKDLPVQVRWDFEHVSDDEFCLPQARVETWDGLVFINMDEDAPPLLEYLGRFTEHFGRWPMSSRWKSAHVGKVIDCNWKAVLDAFLESYHVLATHPQFVLGMDGSLCEYDVYAEEDHWNRMMLSPQVANETLPYEVTEQDVLDDLVDMQMGYDYGFGITEHEDLPDGVPARKVMANRRREQMAAVGMDLSEITDFEITASIQYFVFPNIFPWSNPVFYRFRPLDHERTLFECFLMVPMPEGAPLPPPAKLHMLADDEDFTAAPELGMLAPGFNQDLTNLPLVQKGLLAAGRDGVTLAHYQDIRIRHMHAVIDKYLSSAARR